MLNSNQTTRVTPGSSFVLHISVLVLKEIARPYTQAITAVMCSN